jgi:deoxyribodipyrimidine photo-lyase
MGSEFVLSSVPEIRIRICNRLPVDSSRSYVLYWMIAFRRLKFNFALDRALEIAREIQKPLLILEALRCDYPWASDRLHRFVLDGMAEKLARFQNSRVGYYPYVERAAGGGKGLLDALARRACVVVTDDYPCFFIPKMIRSAAERLPVRVEAVDSNGLLPLRAAERAFTTAHSFRRFLQKTLPAHLAHAPKRDPLRHSDIPALGSVPNLGRWAPASPGELSSATFLASLPLDHRVAPTAMRGGEIPAARALGAFLSRGLDSYSQLRNQPEITGTSRLSPYLHFGHISAHQAFREVSGSENWSEKKIAVRATGSRHGWWGMSEAAEDFLDQFITWRELGFQASSRQSDYDRYEALPGWAKATLAVHARDERKVVYSLRDFAGAHTYDPLWNAAQRQLLREGWIHNYLRMLWGKKVLEWSRTPEEALEIMIELNNRYAPTAELCGVSANMTAPGDPSVPYSAKSVT